MDPHVAELVILSSRVNNSGKNLFWSSSSSSAKLRAKWGAAAAARSLEDSTTLAYSVGHSSPAHSFFVTCLPEMASALPSLSSFSSVLPLVHAALGKSKARCHDLPVTAQDNESGGFHRGTDM